MELKIKFQFNSDWATPIEVAEYLQVSLETLKKWRYQAKGPQWKKFGGRVRYDVLKLKGQ